MFARYEAIISDINGNNIFKGQFTSINKLSKTLCCFDQSKVCFIVNDVLTDQVIDAYELINVFNDSLIIL